MANREFRCAACGAQIFYSVTWVEPLDGPINPDPAARASLPEGATGRWVPWSGPQLCTDGKGHDPDPEAYGRSCG